MLHHETIVVSSLSALLGVGLTGLIVALDGATARVLAGEIGGVRGPVDGIVTDPVYLDFALEPAAVVMHALSPDHNAFVYMVEGDGRVGITESAPEGTRVDSGHLAVLGEGEAVKIAAGEGGARFLLVAARPIGEPIARYGPFVMNTEEELRQAFADLERGTFLG